MKPITAGLAFASRLFDHLARRWKSPGTQRFLGSLLVGSFLGSLLVIELQRQGLIPKGFGGHLPASHFAALEVAFGLLLAFEVVALVFSLASSVSKALGKQFEVFSLILLRQSFEQLAKFEEPIRWEHVSAGVGPLLGDAVGALLIFVVLGFYYRLQRHQPITEDSAEREHFIVAKKAISLLLLVAFLVIGFVDLARLLSGGEPYPFFEAFYTVLVFSDILLVLLSVRTASSFAVMFRNSGFAVATVILRLALTAPSYFNAALGLLAVLFACGLTAAYNEFEPRTSTEAGAAARS